jgi:hypothetical protein
VRKRVGLQLRQQHRIGNHPAGRRLRSEPRWLLSGGSTMAGHVHSGLRGVRLDKQLLSARWDASRHAVLHHQPTGASDSRLSLMNGVSIAANGRIVVAGDGHLYAFEP